MVIRFLDPTLYRSLADALQYLTFIRPDISYVVQHVCLFMYFTLHSGYFGLWFTTLLILNIIMVAYSDDDWVGCPTISRSTSGYCVLLCNNILSLSSKRQFTLSRFSAETKYWGVANAVTETCWLRNFLRELHTPLSSATLVYCDNCADIFTKGLPITLFVEFRSWSIQLSLNVENLEKENYHCKRLCILTKSMSHIFESFKINYKGNSHWVRAIEIPGWNPDLDDQNDEESDSEDEECEEVFKKDFGESDEEVQGENDVNRVSDTEVEEENPKSKDGVVSKYGERMLKNVETDNQKDNYDGEFGNVNIISDEVNFSSGFNTYKKAGGESINSDHYTEVLKVSRIVEISKKEDTCLEWHETKSENSKTCAELELADLELIFDKGDA
ncbi:ribonuclease H-like domain-containing protein [Tanacetum coccineum]